MKAQFRITDPRLLLEASVGELFVPLGPDLVECVCAVRSHATSDGVQLDMTPAEQRNPDTMMPVIVLACREEPGSPEYYPPGFETVLPGASPIVFVHQVQPLQLAPTETRGQADGDMAARHSAEALDSLRELVRRDDMEVSLASRLARGVVHDIVDKHFDSVDLTRPELASKF